MKIRFNPRNVGCWRYDDPNNPSFDMMLFNYIDFDNEYALEEFLKRWFRYNRDDEPEMELSHNYVTFGLVVGYYEYIE